MSSLYSVPAAAAIRTDIFRFSVYPIAVAGSLVPKLCLGTRGTRGSGREGTKGMDRLVRTQGWERMGGLLVFSRLPRSLFLEQDVEYPAVIHVRLTGPAVFNKFRVSTTCFFQSVGQNGQAVPGFLVRDRLS
jgi:hypothetical protein